MVLSHVCPFVGTPAQFPVLSLPTCRDILKYIEFLRYNSIAKKLIHVFFFFFSCPSVNICCTQFDFRHSIKLPLYIWMCRCTMVESADSCKYVSVFRTNFVTIQVVFVNILNFLTEYSHLFFIIPVYLLTITLSKSLVLVQL